MTSDMEHDSSVRGQILGFLDQNTNYFDLINGVEQDLVMQSEINSSSR